jgi:uncharacterized protein YndB with AHSA1/START domain
VAAEPTHLELTMFDIRHRIGIDAPQEDVHHALTTTEGLASWWTTDTEGDPSEGGKVVFSFGGPDRSATFAVTEVTGDRIAWRAVEGPEEWVDTTVTFDLEHEGDETVVLFTHGGWRESVPFLGHCTSKWGSYLLGMKSLLEGGTARPFPGDIHVSSWD